MMDENETRTFIADLTGLRIKDVPEDHPEVSAGLPVPQPHLLRPPPLRFRS